MREDCHGCGMCCINTGWPPYTQEEYKKLPEPLLGKLKRFAASQRGRQNITGACPLYDSLNDRCTEHEVHPKKCNEGFLLNGPECQRLVQIMVIGDRTWKELNGSNGRRV